MQQYFPDTEPERKGYEWTLSSLCSFLSSTRFLNAHFPLLYQFSHWKTKNGFHFLSSNQNPNSTLYQFSSVTKLCPTLCEPMNCSTAGFPVLYYLPECTQTQVHWVSDTIHLILCHSLLLLPSIFPSIRVFSNELALHIRRSKYWSFSFSIILLRSQILSSLLSLFMLSLLCYINNIHFSVAQSCPILCDPMDCSLPDSSVHGIFQVRLLEWVAISFSRGASPSRDWTHLSCIGRQMDSLPLSHQWNNAMD